MNVRRSHLGRFVALTVVVAMPLVGLAGVASAANPVGSAKWCANHPKLAKTTYKAVCAAATGTGTGGSGGTGPAGGDPPLIASVSPDPVPESGTSEADFVIQVEAAVPNTGIAVNISSQQLALSCGSVTWLSSASGTISAIIGTGISPSAPVTLDNDGNATVEVQGENCAPGTDQIEVDLTKAPYTTISSDVTLSPPAESWTPATGPTITAFPNPEVETGDGGTGDAASQVYVNFLVEENPVYAEGTVDVTSEQLTARCGLGTPVWSSTPGDLGTGNTAITSAGATVGVNAELDNDGNADVTFEGLSCAPGPSLIDVELIGGSHDSFGTTFTISERLRLPGGDARHPSRRRRPGEREPTLYPA
jgi:hypothetical protein